MRDIVKAMIKETLRRGGISMSENYTRITDSKKVHEIRDAAINGIRISDRAVGENGF